MREGMGQRFFTTKKGMESWVGTKICVATTMYPIFSVHGPWHYINTLPTIVYRQISAL